MRTKIIRSDMRKRIQYILLSEITSTSKPDFIFGDEHLYEFIQDEVVEKARRDVSLYFYSISHPYGDRYPITDERYIIDPLKKVLDDLKYVVDVTSYYNFQQNEGNDISKLKDNFKSDIPSGHFFIESTEHFAEWSFDVNFKVYPNFLEEVGDRVYVTFLVGME